MANKKCPNEYKMSYCSGCLSSDRPLFPLNENEEIFRLICGYFVLQQQILLCWECTALLRGVRTFQRQVANAQRTLQLYCVGDQAQPQCLTNLNLNNTIYLIVTNDYKQLEPDKKTEEYKGLELKKNDIEVKKEIEEYTDLQVEKETVTNNDKQVETVEKIEGYEDLELKTIEDKDLEVKNIEFIEVKKEIDVHKDLEVKKDLEFSDLTDEIDIKPCVEDLDCTEDKEEYDWSNSEYMDESNAKEDSNEGTLASTTANCVYPPSQILPEKSKDKYEKVYQDFIKWKLKKNTTSFSEHVLLEYFEELATKFKSTSLWTFYSMLKSTLYINHEVDLSKFQKLMAFLKNKSIGSTVKKSKTFSPEEVNRFLKEAPDVIHLGTKIAVIFGITGACRRQELYHILFTDVEVYESTILVKINYRKSNTIRTFTISGYHYELCMKYISLRPTPCHNPCFFLNYRSGKCTSQHVGLNKFGNLGKAIAKFLELPNPQLYTGLCFRRTSATVLVDADGDITPLKGQGRV